MGKSPLDDSLSGIITLLEACSQRHASVHGGDACAGCTSLEVCRRTYDHYVISMSAGGLVRYRRKAENRLRYIISRRMMQYG